MKIQNIKINHYGNLNEKEIELNNSINVIYGKNESGKSTLLSYIKHMLYGISKNKNGKEISDYEKYKPWFKEEFSGRLKYALDNGKEFEIFRDFNKKAPKIYNENLEDISKQFNVDKKEGIQFFYEQTKVDEMIFLSTIVSMQQEVKLERQAQNALVQKMANLVGTGDDSVSYKKVIDRLSKKQVDEIGTDRTQGKPINIIKKRMQEISASLKNMQEKKIEKEEYIAREEEIKDCIYNLEQEEKILKVLEETLQRANVEKEKVSFKNSIKEQNKEKIEKLNSEKKELIKIEENINLRINNTKEEKEVKTKIKNEKKKDKKHLITLVIFIILFIVMQSIYLFVLKDVIINYLSYGLIPICLIYLIIDNLINNKKIKTQEKQQQLQRQLQEEKERYEQEKIKSEVLIIKNKIEVIEQQLLELENENNNFEKDIERVQKETDNLIDLKIEQIKERYTQIELERILENISSNNVRTSIEMTQQKIKEEQIKLNTIEIRRKNIDNELEKMITLQEEYKKLEEEKEELDKQNECIELTKKYLNIAYEKMKNEISPKFTENLSKTISDISNQKYTKVSINDETGLIVENEYGEYVPVNRLSVGTIDQLYLSLRLSMVDEISEESMPIILDEAFAYFDETRLENVLKFLSKRFNKNQIIIFTCTKREQEILTKLNVPYNLVELSV